MTQYTEFVPVRVTVKQKARLQRLAQYGGRKVSDQLRWLIDRAYENTFPPIPQGVPATFEAHCGVCDRTQMFAWQASWDVLDKHLELYNCTAGPYSSIITLRVRYSS